MGAAIGLLRMGDGGAEAALQHAAGQAANPDAGGAPRFLEVGS